MFDINNAYTKNVGAIFQNTDVPERLTASSPSKISKKQHNSFSLLAGPKYSCPGATKACVDCYAMKGNHHMPNVQRALAKNLLLVKQAKRNGANKKIINLLTDVIPKDARIFRIHESGDFMSQWYLDAWTKVIRNRRDVLFWAYTRSFDLDFQHILRQPNFTLWASTDKFNHSEVQRFIKRYRSKNIRKAYGPIESDDQIPDKSFVCPTTNGRLDINGACEKCMLCVRKDRTHKNVVFIKH